MCITSLDSNQPLLDGQIKSMLNVDFFLILTRQCCCWTCTNIDINNIHCLSCPIQQQQNCLSNGSQDIIKRLIASLINVYPKQIYVKKDIKEVGQGKFIHFLAVSDCCKRHPLHTLFNKFYSMEKAIANCRIEMNAKTSPNCLPGKVWRPCWTILYHNISPHPLRVTTNTRYSKYFYAGERTSSLN